MLLNARMLLCSMAALAAALSSAPAARADTHASDSMQHRTVVRFSDLDLNRSSDAAVLYDRIDIAARQVCGPRTLTGSYVTTSGFARCYTNAVEQAVASVNSPQLTALYREQLTQPRLRELSLARQ